MTDPGGGSCGGCSLHAEGGTGTSGEKRGRRPFGAPVRCTTVPAGCCSADGHSSTRPCALAKHLKKHADGVVVEHGRGGDAIADGFVPRGVWPLRVALINGSRYRLL